MTKPPITDAAGVRRWVCDGCGRSAPFHSGYFSYKDFDNGDWKHVKIWCSPECADGQPPPELARPRLIVSRRYPAHPFRPEPSPPLAA